MISLHGCKEKCTEEVQNCVKVIAQSQTWLEKTRELIIIIQIKQYRDAVRHII